MALHNFNYGLANTVGFQITKQCNDDVHSQINVHK